MLSYFSSNHYNKEILEDNCAVCIGEIVAVRNKVDMLWFRAKVLQCAEAKFEVRTYLSPYVLLMCMLLC